MGTKRGTHDIITVVTYSNPNTRLPCPTTCPSPENKLREVGEHPLCDHRNKTPKEKYTNELK